MAANKIFIEKSQYDERILIINIDRPGRLNAFNYELLIDLKKVVEDIGLNPNVQSVIFMSTTLKAFSAGIDVNYVKGIGKDEEVADFFYELADLFERIMQLPVTTIAAINGYAFGAGADLALACDIRIANEQASFRFPGPQFGVVLGTQRLIQEVGSSKARHLILFNKLVHSEDALSYGIVHEVVSNINCFERAEQLALQLLEMPLTTETTIRSLCRFTVEKMMECDAREYAKESIMAVDFQKTFESYEKRMRK